MFASSILHVCVFLVSFGIIKHAGSGNIYTKTNWRVSLSKICHEWPNNAVTHECA
jgi:hypothetical protein